MHARANAGQIDARDCRVLLQCTSNVSCPTAANFVGQLVSCLPQHSTRIPLTGQVDLCDRGVLLQCLGNVPSATVINAGPCSILHHPQRT